MKNKDNHLTLLSKRLIYVIFALVVFMLSIAVTTQSVRAVEIDADTCLPGFELNDDSTGCQPIGSQDENSADTNGSGVIAECDPDNGEDCARCDPEDNADGSPGELNAENCGIVKYLVIGINVLSALAGMAIVFSMMFAGYQYMTARDNSGQIQQARQRIIWAITALLLFIFMYAILNFLVPGGLQLT